MGSCGDVVGCNPSRQVSSIGQLLTLRGQLDGDELHQAFRDEALIMAVGFLDDDDDHCPS